VTGANKEVLQDTANSARKTAKVQGLPRKRSKVGFMYKGGISVGGYGQELQDTSYRVLVSG
jgi:hypothetical protein